MIKVQKNFKDISFRFKKKNFEKKKKILEYLMYNENLSFKKRILFFSKFYKIKRKFRINTKIKNRCIFSGRSRGVLSHFKVSRHFFKKFTKNAILVNVKKNK